MSWTLILTVLGLILVVTALVMIWRNNSWAITFGFVRVPRGVSLFVRSSRFSR